MKKNSLKRVNWYMNFNQYRENVNHFMDDYYTSLSLELQKRPESSYPVIFEEEFATMKRYAHSLYKEVYLDLKDHFEKSLNEVETERMSKKVTNPLESCRIVPISYQSQNIQRESTIVKSSSTMESLISEPKNLSSPSTFKKPAISGLVVGGIAGGVLGKTIALATFGGAAGGAAACAATYYYIKEKNTQFKKQFKTNEIREQNGKKEVSHLIESRRENMKSTLFNLVNQVEEQYKANPNDF